MATYDSLMVYKHAYDLTVDMMLLTKKMDRGFKFTIGERVNTACVEMLLCVYRINTSTQRDSFFVSAREQIEQIRLLLRLMKEESKQGLDKSNLKKHTVLKASMLRVVRYTFGIL